MTPNKSSIVQLQVKGKRHLTLKMPWGQDYSVLNQNEDHIRPYWHYVLLSLIVLLSGTMGYFSLDNGHPWWGDFALYIRQAESLLNGTSQELLALNKYAMEKSVYTGSPIGPDLYPWGFPLLLTPVYAAFGLDIMALKMYMVLFLPLSLLVVWYLCRDRLGRGHTLLLVALMGFHPYLVQYANLIHSDLPYLLFALLSLLLIQRVMEKKWIGNEAFTYFLTGFVMVGAMAIRTTGFLLPVVYLLCQLVVNRAAFRSFSTIFTWRNFKILLPCLYFLTGIGLIVLWLPSGSGSYLNFFEHLTPYNLSSRFVKYLALPAKFYDLTNSSLLSLVPYTIYGLTLPFALIGLARNLLKDLHFVLFTVLTLAVVIVFPIPVFLRLILPLFPIYFYFTFLGMMQAETFLKRKGALQGRQLYNLPFRRERIAGWLTNIGRPIRIQPALLVLTFGGLMLTLFLTKTSAEALKNMNNGRLMEKGAFAPLSQEMISFITSNTPPEAEIIFHDPRGLSMLTKRQSFRIKDLATIEAGRGDYLVYVHGKKNQQVNKDELNQLKKRLLVRFENKIYGVIQLKNLPASYEGAKETGD